MLVYWLENHSAQGGNTMYVYTDFDRAINALTDVYAIQYSNGAPLVVARQAAEVQVALLLDWNKRHRGDITRGTVYTFHDFHLRAAELI